MTFSLPTGDELPEKLPKLYGSKSGQKKFRAKSSAIPSTSVDTSENIEGPSADIPLVSEGATFADTPSGEEQASTSEGVKLASDVSVSEDFQFEWPQATESMANVSDNTASNLVITNVRSVGVMSSSEVSRSGGLSAEDMPPLELNKHLHVSIECYPNLLKHFQEGKVRIKKLLDQDVRLTAIKSKKVSAEVFSKFYIDNTSCEWPEKSVPSSVGDTTGNESGSSSSSSDEGDNTEDDEDYVPDPSEGHPGMSRMKGLPCLYVWWPRMDTDIKETVHHCSNCQVNRSAPPAAPLHPWSWPTHPWTQINVDYASPFISKTFLS